MQTLRRTLPGILGLVFLAASSQLAADEPPVPIRQFVTQHYFHGLPYEQARAYGAEAVPELAQMLREDEHQPFWANIVMTLGMGGDAAATPVLLEHFAGRSGEVSPDAFRSLISVPTALGYLALAGDEAALREIIGWARISDGEKSAPAFHHGRYQGPALREALGRVAVQALGISGRPEAGETLRGLWLDASVPEDWSDNLEEALALHAKVESLGAEMAFAGGEP